MPARTCTSDYSYSYTHVRTREDRAAQLPRFTADLCALGNATAVSVLS